MNTNKYNIKPFDGNKYSIWKLRIRALLAEHNVLKVIENEKPYVVNVKWRKSERLAKSLVVQHLSDSFLGFATDDMTAKDIIESLNSIYERKSIVSQLTLRKKLLCLKFSDGNLINHFTIFDDLITELVAAGAKLEEMDLVSHLLLTMPSEYDGVITALEILSEDKLTLTFVKNRLLDHETKIRSANKDICTKVLIAVGENHQNKITNKNKYQNKRIIKPYNKTKRAVGDKKCHHCGRKGHFKIDCFHYKKQQQQQIHKKENYKTAQAITTQVENGFAFMIKCQGTIDRTSFLLDSGASDHMINDTSMFTHSIKLDPPLKISVAKSGQYIYATRKGIIKCETNIGQQITLKDVLFCKDVPQNLLSVSRMQDAGLTIEFKAGGVTVKKGDALVFKGNFFKNLPIVDFKVCYNISTTLEMRNEKYRLWHERLGHISKDKFNELKSKEMFFDVDLIKNVQPSDNICEACLNGKQARFSFKKTKNKDNVVRPLFMIHSDVCGPITPPTIDGKNYYVVFIDQFTHYLVTYLITYKSEVFKVFKDFVSKSEAHFNLKTVNLYIDNGREYLSGEMKGYCVEKGISYHLTVPYTPQQNGVAERMIRTITEKARSILNGAKLEKSFWGEAVLTASFIINRTPSNVLRAMNKTPYEMWHSKKPQLKYLKVFGSTAYVHEKVRKAKFDAKSFKAILVGYEPNGYKLWVSDKGRFITARDVIFDEVKVSESRPTNAVEKNCNVEQDISGQLEPENGNPGYVITGTPAGEAGCEEISDQKESENESPGYMITDTPVGEAGDVEGSGQVGSDMPREMVTEENVKPVATDVSACEDTAENSCSSSSKRKTDCDLRRSKRIRKLPPISYHEHDKDIRECVMSAQYLLENIPKTYDEIKTRSDKTSWEKAIKDELDAHIINKTWSIVKRPQNKNIVDCRWIFTIKHDEFGNPIKYKARLVARGFTQEYLADYDETFAPVARVASFRFLLVFSNQYDLIVHHMDVKTAFLNGVLKEEIYMTIPQGVQCSEKKVCKLNKAIYGLKQAARCWFEVFELSLKEKGFVHSAVDRCLYILDKGDIAENIYVLLYVDDLMISTRNAETLLNFKKYLMSKFRMTDLLEVKHFTGIKVERTNNTICLSQSAYISNVLKKFNMADCKSVSTPLPSQINYEDLNSDENYNAPCRQLIGSLMYIMLCTRPDISTAVNILSRYSNKSNLMLWQNIKRVLRYLKGTIDLKLVYKKKKQISLMYLKDMQILIGVVAEQIVEVRLDLYSKCSTTVPSVGALKSKAQ